MVVVVHWRMFTDAVALQPLLQFVAVRVMWWHVPSSTGP